MYQCIYHKQPIKHTLTFQQLTTGQGDNLCIAQHDLRNAKIICRTLLPNGAIILKNIRHHLYSINIAAASLYNCNFIKHVSLQTATQVMLQPFNNYVCCYPTSLIVNKSAKQCVSSYIIVSNNSLLVSFCQTLSSSSANESLLQTIITCLTNILETSRSLPHNKLVFLSPSKYCVAICSELKSPPPDLSNLYTTILTLLYQLRSKQITVIFRWIPHGNTIKWQNFASALRDSIVGKSHPYLWTSVSDTWGPESTDLG